MDKSLDITTLASPPNMPTGLQASSSAAREHCQPKPEGLLIFDGCRNEGKRRISCFTAWSEADRLPSTCRRPCMRSVLRERRSARGLSCDSWRRRPVAFFFACCKCTLCCKSKNFKFLEKRKDTEGRIRKGKKRTADGGGGAVRSSMLAGRRCAQRAMCCNLSWSCRPLSSGENRSFWASQRAANTSQRIGPAFVFHPRIPRTCHSFHYSRPFPYRADPSLDIDRYHKVSDTTLDALVESLEAIFEDPQYVPEPFDDGPEVEYSSGVMTIRMGGGRGTYVINKQPPNQQIWLSSPIR